MTIQFCCNKIKDKKNNFDKFNKMIDCLNKIVNKLDNYKKPCPNIEGEKTVDKFNKIIDQLNKIIASIDKCKDSSNESIDNNKIMKDFTKLIEKLDKIFEKFNCCEKNAEQIEDIENKLEKNKEDLDNTLKELERKCEDKLKQQIEDIENKLEKNKEDLDSTLKELENKQNDKNKNLEDALKKLDNEKWIIGEYRWMPIGSVMPKGWVKIDIAQGYTLVQGTQTGKTVGKIKSHNHNFLVGGVWNVDKIFYGNGTVTGASNCLFPYVQSLNNAAVTYSTAEEGKDITKNQIDNLPAGIFAELWQFQGSMNDDSKDSDESKNLRVGR